MVKRWHKKKKKKEGTSWLDSNTIPLVQKFHVKRYKWRLVYVPQEITSRCSEWCQEQNQYLEYDKIVKYYTYENRLLDKDKPGDVAYKTVAIRTLLKPGAEEQVHVRAQTHSTDQDFDIHWGLDLACAPASSSRPYHSGE